VPVRARDTLGRPVPPGSAAAVEQVEDLPRTAAAALALADRLLAAGRAFSAHEVLESAWKAAPAPERETWRALAQLAVGVTHAQRGNTRGAVTLLRRAAGGLAGRPVLGDVRIAAAALAGWAEALADAIQADGLPAALPVVPALMLA